MVVQFLKFTGGKMKRNAFSKGVTLIEVLVASLILVITIGPMLYFLVFNQTSVHEAACETNASFLIRDEFERIKKSVNLNAVCGSSNSIGRRLGSSNAEIVKIDNINYSLYFDTTTVTLSGGAASATNPKLLKLTANVTWNYSTKDHSMSMSMLSNNF